MSFEVKDCYAGIKGLLQNRAISNTMMQEEMRKAVLELTEDYKHPLLEETGPIVALTAFQSEYDPDFFLQVADHGLDVEKINSFFLFNNPYVVPSTNNNGTNSGYEVPFRSIDSIEVLINIPGLPLYWTRNNNKFYVTLPDQSYNCYVRYQKEHPLANEVNGFSDDTQQIMMADSWQEILEYAAALRIAPKVNLADKRTELHTALYGSQKFQTSGGIEGAPGLIFQRTSQRNRDQRTTTRRLRLRMGIQ